MKFIEPVDNSHDFDIAIIGMSGQFPGAKDIQAFWQNLTLGKESVSFFTDEQLLENGVVPGLLDDPNYVKAAPILDEPEFFDASFFGYSPKEAKMMDPQHRLFLECAWEALENAGYNAEKYPGLIGVYGGTNVNTYLLFGGLIPNLVNDYLSTLIGNDKDFLTTRVSYKMNLRGPSLTIQTACSTSLVAVHLACQGLLNHESDIALAGGVTVRYPHRVGYIYEEGSIRSPDGHCRAFDARAKGTPFGSGVGIVVLKRYADAIADGDTLTAIIRGSAINNDGSLKAGYTAPSVEGQSEVVIQALANASVDAESISFIEAHGTGTILGDPIEVAALTEAFRTQTEKTGFCAIGSVKSNFGHLDAAAGVASLIKAALALKYKKIPPTLHFENPNPKIDFENSPFFVNQGLMEWEPEKLPRRAGVSSLGVGGTNCHIILEEAPAPEALTGSTSPQVLVLSAKTNKVLETAHKNLVQYLKENPDLDLADVAYTSQVGRKAFDYRRMILCQDLDDAINALETQDSKRVFTSFHDSTTKDVIFMFSGQGSQYVNMGLDLYRTNPTFRYEVDQCSEILQNHLPFNLLEAIFPGETNREESENRLKQTYVTQPALFTIEYALAKLWMFWGVQPTALVGHSIGEYVAACLAGVFSLEDALALVAARGRLMQDLPGGSMLAVLQSEHEVKPYLNSKLSLAVINSPAICVLSGETVEIDRLEKELVQADVGFRRLHTSHAFHSKMMDPILEEFSIRVSQANPQPPKIPFLSNVTGTWITNEEAISPSYWAKHLRQTVRFSDCLHELLLKPNRVLLEVGPGRTLSTLTQQHPSKSSEHIVLASTRHPKDEKSDDVFILETLGKLWFEGIEIDWAGFHGDHKRKRIPLPTYPFERKRYWIDNGASPFLTGSAVMDSMEESIEEATTQDQAQMQLQKDRVYKDAPRDEVEQTIAKIWEEMLGVENVRIHDDFFELGGSSLIAVSLFAQINKTFGRQLPLATLFEAPTIEQLADLLRVKKWTASWSPLVQIQAGDSRPPFFCVHAEGGNVVGYRDLAKHMGKDQPFYGLQSRGLSGEPIVEHSFEELAQEYIKEIQKIQPHGPYLLGGWCLGGSIAYEMVQQLQGESEQVDLLAMIQSRHPHYWKYRPRTTRVHKLSYRIVDRIHYEMSNLKVSGLKAKMGYLWQRAGRAREMVQIRMENITEAFSTKDVEGNTHSLSYTLEAVAKMNRDAFWKYEPGPYRGGVVIFRASHQPRGIIPDPTLGWGDLLEGEVELYEVPAFHQTVLLEPQVKGMAQQLRDCIDHVIEQRGKSS
jgi:phthiocerol/phenolphthiocerol synthesis type-I polyketide synthase E